MSDLFQVTVAAINEHLKNLANDGEIDANRTIRKFLIVQTAGKREVSRQVDHYSLKCDEQKRRQMRGQFLAEI